MQQSQIRQTIEEEEIRVRAIKGAIYLLERESESIKTNDADLLQRYGALLYPGIKVFNTYV